MMKNLSKHLFLLAFGALLGIGFTGFSHSSPKTDIPSSYLSISLTTLKKQLTYSYKQLAGRIEEQAMMGNSTFVPVKENASKLMAELPAIERLLSAQRKVAASPGNGPNPEDIFDIILSMRAYQEKVSGVLADLNEEIPYQLDFLDPMGDDWGIHFVRNDNPFIREVAVSLLTIDLYRLTIYTLGRLESASWKYKFGADEIRFVPAGMPESIKAGEKFSFKVHTQVEKAPWVPEWMSSHRVMLDGAFTAVIQGTGEKEGEKLADGSYKMPVMVKTRVPWIAKDSMLTYQLDTSIIVRP